MGHWALQVFDVDRMIDLLEALEEFYKDANSSRGDMDHDNAAHSSTASTSATSATSPSTPPALLPPPQNLPTSVNLGNVRLQIPNPLNLPMPFPNPQVRPLAQRFFFLRPRFRTLLSSILTPPPSDATIVLRDA